MRKCSGNHMKFETILYEVKDEILTITLTSLQFRS